MLLIICLLCVAMVAVILFGVKQFRLGSQLASMNQVANLSHLLVRQQTNILSLLLLNNAKAEKLTESLDNLTKERFVLDASLYASNGELLAQSSNRLNLKQQLGLAKNNDMTTQQIVEPIYSTNGVEGFLRITFDTKHVQTTQGKIDQLFHRLYAELLIVLAAGIMLTSSIHYFLTQYRRTKRLELSSAHELIQKTNASKNFHRRRRRV
ncbi:protein AhpA [Lonepinella sp. MS14437]